MTRKKIIIIEDDPDILEIMKIILGKTYDLSLFLHPPDNFIAIITEKQPGIIIFDWILPHVTIDDYFQDIRRISPHTKIMIISAHYDLQNAFADKDVDALMNKPFGIEELKNKVSELLSVTVVPKQK